jgi:hypothetical protein
MSSSLDLVRMRFGSEFQVLVKHDKRGTKRGKCKNS